MNDGWVSWVDCVTRYQKDLICVVEIVEAYLDESYRDVSGCPDRFLATGTLFYPRRAKRVAREWQRIFPAGYHGREFNAQCVGRMRRQQQVKNLVAGALIGKEAEYVSCVTCSAADALEAFGGGKNAQAKAYLTCAAISAFALAYYLRSQGRKERIAYLFDQGRKGEAERTLNEVFERIHQDEEMKEIYRYSTQTMGSAKEVPLLQVADFVTWECGFDKVARDTAGIRRESYGNLIRGLGRKAKYRKPEPTTLYYVDYDSKGLKDFAEWFAGLRENVPILQPRVLL